MAKFCAFWAMMFVIVAGASGCKDGQGEKPASTGAQEPAAQMILADIPPMKEKIPIFVVWDPAVADGTSKEIEAEGKFFMSILRGNLGYAPEPLLDTLTPNVMDRMLPVEGAKLYRPMREWSDRELGKIAIGVAADYMIYTDVSEVEGKPRIQMQLLNIKMEELWRLEMDGTWEQIGEQFARNSLALYAAIGVKPTEQQARVISSSRIGDGVSFSKIARASFNDKATASQLLPLFEEWQAGDPGQNYVKVWILVNQFEQETQGSKEAIMTELNDRSKPFNTYLAAKFAYSLGFKKRKYADGLHIYERLLEAYPNYRMIYVNAGYFALWSGNAPVSKQFAKQAREAGNNSWLVDALDGENFELLTNNAQRGRTVNNFSPAERMDFAKGNQGMIDSFGEAVKKNPNDPYALAELADGMMRNGGDSNKVLELCERALELNPNAQEAISVMVWECAPGYSNQCEKGRAIIVKYQDNFLDPSKITYATSAMRQNLIGNMTRNKGANGGTNEQNDTFDACDKHPIYAQAMGVLLLRSLDYKHADSNMERWNFFMATQMLSYIDAELTPGQVKPLRDNWKTASKGNVFETQWIHFNGAFIMELAGDYETAREMYEMARTGPDAVMQQMAKARLQMLDARKNNDISAALAFIDGPEFASNPKHDLFKLELLITGNEAQAEEGVRFGEQLPITREVMLSLSSAYLKQNAPAKLIRMFGKNIGRDAELPLAFTRRYKEACEKLGISPDLHPKDAEKELPPP